MLRKQFQMVTSIFLLVITFIFAPPGILTAQAALHLELTQGISGSIPIAIVPFTGQSIKDKSPGNIFNVLSQDLKNSGRFRVLPTTKIEQFPAYVRDVKFDYWKQTGVDDIVIGRVKSLGNDRYQINFSVLSVYQGEDNSVVTRANSVLVSKQFIVKENEFRRVAHRISDIVFQQLTGIKGVFSTRIAYVLVEQASDKSARYSLEIADADGYNPRPLLVSKEPIMSPEWSPDGKQIAYVSFENKHSAVYSADIATGKRTRLTNYPGINGAPTWSPDGRQLALVLSKTGSPKIYTMNLRDHKLQQLTHGRSIDTEPSWAPDGKSIIFTSNRGGTPQIYRLSLIDGRISRMTFDGNYNATASFTPNSADIVLLHQGQRGFNIALQELASGALMELTMSGYDSSPSISPNGKMVIYANNNGKQGTLGIVSTDSKIKLTLPAPEGSVQEPAWSPFL